MSGYFKIKSKVKLEDLDIGTRIEPSDFATLSPSGTFVQLEYIEEVEEIEKYKVYPGIYTVALSDRNIKLEPTRFTTDKTLGNNKYVSSIIKQVDNFFQKKEAYKKYGFDVPKRGWLFYGPPGCGKSSILKELANIYNQQKDTLIVLWPSDKIDPGEMKSLIKSFEYININKFILMIEDLGGVEIDQVRIKSMSALLSLLDNVEKTFSIPTAILATTNFPENFLGNITNRPQRFDTKIEIGLPTGEERIEFLKFFSNNSVDENILTELKKTNYNKLTPSHIKEILMRSELNDLSLVDSLKEIKKEIDIYEKLFQANKQKFGIVDPDFD